MSRYVVDKDGEEDSDRLVRLHHHQLLSFSSSDEHLPSFSTGEPNSVNGGAGAGDDHLQLHSTTATITLPPVINSSGIASTDILHSIFERLPVADLARAACVCRLWNSVASNREVQKLAFMSPWKLREIVGTPSSGAFWRDNGLSKFALSHRVARSDTVAGLAVKYRVQVTEIKRLNNMLSDHGIHSRERLLIPISDQEVLRDETCHIEMDVHAKREVVVLYPGGTVPPQGKASFLASGSGKRSGKKKIVDSMKRSLLADDGTVEYYLSISNGDPRAAFSLFSEDLKWEQDSTKTVV